MKPTMIAALISATAFLVACDESSETEKVARRANAFDLAGQYTATRAIDSEIELEFKIENRADRSDVVVKLTRGYPLTTREATLFSQFGISESQVSSAVGTAIQLEAGYAARDFGGANISDDFGKTSTIRVDSRSYVLGGGLSVVYRLRGTVKKEDLTFTGTLGIDLTRETTPATSHSDVNSSQANLKVIARTDMVSWTQVFGVWSGRVDTDGSSDSAAVKALGSIRIIRNANDTFSVSPEMRELIFRGENYQFVDESRPLADLRAQASPLVKAVWQSASGKRLVLVASIWSLGQFTGNIIWEHDQDQSLVAGFQLKRM